MSFFDWRDLTPRWQPLTKEFSDKRMIIYSLIFCILNKFQKCILKGKKTTTKYYFIKKAFRMRWAYTKYYKRAESERWPKLSGIFELLPIRNSEENIASSVNFFIRDFITPHSAQTLLIKVCINFFKKIWNIGKFYKSRKIKKCQRKFRSFSAF